MNWSIWPWLKTLELNNLNPNILIITSTVDTFNFLVNPLVWISLLGFQPIEFTLIVHQIPSFSVFSSGAMIGWVYQTKDYINLQINRKESSSIDLDINNSKVLARDIYTFIFLTCPVNSALNFLLSSVQSGNLKNEFLSSV